MTYDPDPFKNFTPRGNPPKPLAQQPAPEVVDLSRLDAMTKAELIELVRRSCPQEAIILAMSDDEQAQAMLDRLAILALKKDAGMRLNDIVGAIREWLDRKHGKPAQRVELDQRTIAVQMQAVVEGMGAGEARLLLEALQSA